MLDEWMQFAMSCAVKRGDFYSGARKILRAKSVTFENIKDDLKIQDCGFTRSKMTMLRKNYLHEESRNMAVELWRGRLERDKYGSVGFHCYNHLVKGGDLETKRSKRASVMGPCIQAVTLTLLNDRTTAVDIFYRTTEVFKKFPADLVFIRDELLVPFDLSKAPLKSITFNFANVTCHPMYFVTAIPLMEDPFKCFERIKERDPYFFNWAVKWTARYVCDEYHRGIAKFAQAQRTKMDALSRIDKDTLKELQKYLRSNHPGHRNEYDEEEIEE